MWKNYVSRVECKLSYVDVLWSAPTGNAVGIWIPMHGSQSRVGGGKKKIDGQFTGCIGHSLRRDELEGELEKK